MDNAAATTQHVRACLPAAASAKASCAENVLLPTPPLPESTSTCKKERRGLPEHDVHTHRAVERAHLVPNMPHALRDGFQVGVCRLGRLGARRLRCAANA